jgi:phospholipid/cholesterol/gamma-HCH transport system substrate-binding protein
MSEARSIEVKVGLLILVGVGLLAALILVMGGVSFNKRFPLFVDFDNPGGIQPGAPVKMAGVRVGTIDSLEFRASPPDPTSGRRTLVRARILVDERYHPEIRRDAEFYVTTQGVLGEQFLAIEPGTRSDRIAPGSIVVGQGPPRIDLFVARAYTLLDDAVSAIHSNRDTIHGIVSDLAGVLHTTNTVLARNAPQIDQLVADVNQVVRDTDTLVNSARQRYVDGEQVRRIISRTDGILGSLERDVPALTRDARQLTTQLNRVAGAVGDQQLQELRDTIHGVQTLTTRANSMAQDAQRVVAHVRQGRGTVGAMLMDEEMYDDLQELVRDLKHNPWKFFWRE